MMPADTSQTKQNIPKKQNSSIPNKRQTLSSTVSETGTFNAINKPASSSGFYANFDQGFGNSNLFLGFPN